MTTGAHVSSIEALREFRAALCTFAQEARDGLCNFDLEIRRSLDWLLDEAPKYWQQEVRASDEAVFQAKMDLARCKATPLPGGGQPSCMEEKKVLERARQRRERAEQKVGATRKWGYLAQRETTEYSSRATQLSGVLDADLPRAIAALDRAMSSLEAYIKLPAAIDRPAGAAGTQSPDASSAARPLPENESPAKERESGAQSDQEPLRKRS